MIKTRIPFVFLILFYGLCHAAIFTDGVDDLGTIPDDPSFAPLTGGFTFMCWAKSGISADGRQIWFDQYESGSEAIHSGIDPVRATAGNIYVYFFHRGAGGNETFDSEISVGIDVRGNWHHYAFVRPENGSGNLKFYFDGTEYKNGNRIANNSIDPEKDLSILLINGSSEITFDDYVVVKRELTIQEIRDHMIRRWIPDDDTVICIPMTEGSGSRYDISPYGNHCSWAGGTVAGGAPILQIR